MIEIEPKGLTDRDMAAILTDLACTAPGATGFLWHYSEERRIVLVGAVHDRKLVQWLMQPAPTEAEAERVAGKWAAMLSNADAVREVLAVVSGAVDGNKPTH